MTNRIKITTKDPATGNRITVAGRQAAALWQSLAEEAETNTQANNNTTQPAPSLPDWATDTLPTLTPNDLAQIVRGGGQ